jgi:hypothetical protein
MPQLSEQEMFKRIEIALAVYKKENPSLDLSVVDTFVSWMYNQYGIVRKQDGT